MAECIYMIAVNVSNRPIGADCHVATDQLDADHRTREYSSADPLRFRTACAYSLLRSQAHALQLGSEGLESAWSEAAERQGSRDLGQISRGGKSLLVLQRIRPRQSSVKMRKAIAFSNITSPAGESGRGEHLFNRLNSSYGFLRVGESESDSSHEFAIDIDRASAHTLQDAGLGQRTSAQSGQNDGLIWGGVLEDAEDLDIELFDAVALEDSAADAMLPWMHIPERENSLGTDWTEYQKAENNGREHPERASTPRIMKNLTHISYCSARWLAELRCD